MSICGESPPIGMEPMWTVVGEVMGNPICYMEMLKKNRQTRSRPFSALTYCGYALHVKMARALLDELFLNIPSASGIGLTWSLYEQREAIFNSPYVPNFRCSAAPMKAVNNGCGEHSLE